MHLLAPDTIRRCIAAEPGHAIISADYDQIELRVAAGFAGEHSLIDAAKRGESLHKVAAIKLFGPNYTADDYRHTKNVNFGWLYGGGARTLSEQAGIPFAEAKAIIALYASQFPALTRAKKQAQYTALRSAFTAPEYQVYQNTLTQLFRFSPETTEGRLGRATVQRTLNRYCAGRIGKIVTPYGRHLPVDALRPYTAFNYLVQSTSRDILMDGLRRLMEDPETEPTVLLPIHDEVLGHAPIATAEYLVTRYSTLMTTEFRSVPLTAAGKVYGRTWGHGYSRK